MSRLGIRGKLLALAMAAAAAALLVTVVLLTVAERWRMERHLRQDQAALARIVADNVTAALSFIDPEAAAEVLRSLRAKRHVVLGCVYARDGGLFAAYRRTDAGGTCPPRAADLADAPRTLLAPVVLDGQEIGQVLLASDRSDIVQRLRIQGWVLLGAVTVAALAALLLSLRLRRVIAEPVDELARTADAVTRGGDFTLRARRTSTDELGDLVAAFNQMLAQIESRDAALVDANAELRREVEERQRAEDAKASLLVREKEARREAESASRLKDEFLATLSHELRTPLNAILGWASMLRQRPDEPTATRAGEVIERNAVAQARLIADLLDVSAIVTGKMRLEPQRVDLAQVVAAVDETVRPTADAKHLRLAVDLATDLPPLHADPARLQQVLWNLLANAVKFTPAGGGVRLTARRAGDEVEIEVADDGIGIPADFLPYVFDRFRQRDASTTRQHGGLGLGLAVVRHLVELHGGSVDAESDGDGRGATFRVRLPAAEAPALRDDSGVFEAPAAPLSGLRVLVVEDAADSAELYRAVLAAEGADVRLATSAEAARRDFTTAPPDVLVCDIGLPGEDGYSLLAWVRDLPPDRGRDVPAAALTAYAGDGDVRRAHTAGFDLHLAKPLPPDRLVAAVAELGGRHPG